jgi:hypothetical protein
LETHKETDNEKANDSPVDLEFDPHRRRVHTDRVRDRGSADDGLMSSIFANVSFAQISNFEYETLDYEGVIMLPEEEWETGATWSTRYVVKATATIEGMTLDTQMDIVLDHNLAAFEEITVPAGTFDAARVDSTGTFKLTDPVAMEINFPYSIWYAEGIGMVRVYGENEFGTSRVELASLTTSE